MKKKLIAITFSVSVLLVACKKESNMPWFSATGFWTGTTFAYESALLNRNDGTARYYLLVANNDTTLSGAIYDGRYLISEHGYLGVFPIDGDTLFFQTRKTSSGFMSGFYKTSSTPGYTLPFEFIKQP